LKLAILTDGIFPFAIGGMQKHSFYLAKFLVQQGVDVTLVHCVTQGKVPTRDQVLATMELSEAPNLRIIGFKFPKAGWLPGHYVKENYLYSIQIFEELKSPWNEFDFIYAKGFSAWHLLNKKRKGKNLPPIGVKFHGYEMFQPAPSFRVKMEHYLLRGPVKFNNINADYIFSYGGKISELVRKEFKTNLSNIIELPTGIEAAWCIDAPVEKVNLIRKFIFIGRFERRKGVEELNQVLRSLPKETPFSFDFIGPIPPSQYIKDDRIIYHGKMMEKEKIQAILDQCDVLVTPSHSEGMPNVIMEGMARGLAVIATDVGAVAAQVNEENGWLIQPANIAALKKSILEAIECSDAVLLGKRNTSLERVKNQFTWEEVAKETLEKIKAIV
jgi:glycosyltransferase involved in cell wall biosynthesis